jgi:hypothetical protein
LKKSISILFFLTYLNVALGTSIDCQYCCGKLVNFKLSNISISKAKCGRFDISMRSGCCKNEIHYCKTDNHKSPVVLAIKAPETLIKTPVFLINSLNSFPFVEMNHVISILYLRQRRSDGEPACSLFISNRVLRI